MGADLSKVIFRFCLLMLLPVLAVGKPPMRVPSKLMATGDRAHSMGSYQKAVEIFEEGLERRPQSKRFLIGLIKAKSQLNRCDEARDDLLPKRHTRVANREVLEGLAACFLRVGDYSEAVEWQQERILLNPPKVGAFARLGSYQLAAGDREGAKRSLARAVEMDPMDASVFALRLQFAIGKGQVVETELLFDEWDRAGDKRTLLNWYLRSQYAMDLGDLDLAMESSTSCVQMNFQYSPIRVLRSELFRRLGLLEQARSAVDTIASKSLVVVGIEAIQIRIDADLGLYQEAHKRLQALQEIDPIRPDVLASAWYLAQAEGDVSSAQRYRQRYETLQSNPYRILESLIPVTPSRGTP